MILVAYQGERGAYSEQAAYQFFTGQQIRFRPCRSFSDTLNDLSCGTVDRAVLPIENSLAGTLHENLDLLLRYPDLTIVGECDFHVHHCLLALPGVRMEDIKVVRSHYMALSQCNGYLRDKSLIPEVGYDTAGCAQEVAEKRLDNMGAIAGKNAAEVYGLNILGENIEDDRMNFTRFLILSKTPEGYVEGVPSKSSLVFSLINAPGILCRALSVFAVTGIDLLKIESRHIRTVQEALMDQMTELKEEATMKRWGYVFYVDIAKHVDEKAVKSALNHLQEITTFFRMLGSYPRHTVGEEKLGEGDTV